MKQQTAIIILILIGLGFLAWKSGLLFQALPEYKVVSSEVIGEVGRGAEEQVVMSYACPTEVGTETFDKCSIQLQWFYVNGVWEGRGAGGFQIFEKGQTRSVTKPLGAISYDQRGFVQKLSYLRECDDGSIRYTGECPTTEIPPQPPLPEQSIFDKYWMLFLAGGLIIFLAFLFQLRKK